MTKAREELREQVREESLGAAYVSAIRTAVRSNASAYGFSGAVTGSYGVVYVDQGGSGILSTILFVIGIATAFVALELLVSRLFTREIESDPRGVVTVASAVNLLSMGSAVATAYGAGQATGGVGWFLAGLTSTAVYLSVGAVDVLVARIVVRSFRTGERSGGS